MAGAPSTPLVTFTFNFCIVAEFHILGDSAYPLKLHLITPYKDTGALSFKQKAFNQKLSSVRIKIEHCFGLLKQRFRQLYHCKIRTMKFLCHFIRACAVCHNIIIKFEDASLCLNNTVGSNLNQTYANDTTGDEVEENEEENAEECENAQQKRNRLCESFN